MRKNNKKKNSKKRGNRGRALIWLGLLLTFGAIGLTAYNLWDDQRAGEEAEEALTKLEVQMPAAEERVVMGDITSPTVIDGVYMSTMALKLRAMPVKEVDGKNYIGVLDIPALNLSLPIMDTWDYARLKVTPCRFSGSYYSDDLVICGHNYPRHFSGIKWINIGTEIYFTNVLGEMFVYEVEEIEILQPTAVEDMVLRDGWDLTLFTCTTGGQTRCAVRCVRVEAP